MIFLTKAKKKYQRIHRFGETQTTVLDISKTFNRVWHKAFLSKMNFIGICPKLLGWIKSFPSEEIISLATFNASVLTQKT